MQRPLQAIRDNGQRTTNRRSAFSLIELVVVILVIAILSSLLLIGVQAAVGRAREASVGVEVKNLEQGIKEFQGKFSISDYPPSGLILCENDTLWAANSTAANNALIRHLWPQFLQSTGVPYFNVENDSMHAGFDAYEQDINGDGDHTDVIYLNGAECLVFFLGGIMESGPTGFIPHGFSANPRNPFWRSEDINGNGALNGSEDVNSNGVLDGWGTRVGPFADFRSARLVDDDGDFMPVYLDAFPSSQNPYQYFSAYGGRGYRIFGVDNPNPTTAPGSMTSDDEVIWKGGRPSIFSVYLQSDTAATTAANLPKGTSWSPKGYQILSAGADGEWGIGGRIDDAGVLDTVTKMAPNNAMDYRAYTNTTTGEKVRAYEVDNITSFKGGKLN